mgnify:CR=1 FL=1
MKMTEPYIMLLEFSSEAKAYFTNWRNNAVRAVNQIQDDGLVDSRVIKAPMITARLALVLQILRWACGEEHKDFVDIDSTKSAIALSEYFENCYTNIQNICCERALNRKKENCLIAFPQLSLLPMPFKPEKK